MPTPKPPRTRTSRVPRQARRPRWLITGIFLGASVPALTGTAASAAVAAEESPLEAHAAAAGVSIVALYAGLGVIVAIGLLIVAAVVSVRRRRRRT